MRITVIGSGYVGLVTGACLAELGNDVHCPDLADRPQLLAQIAYSASQMEALHGADALLIVTEWKAFRSPDFEALKTPLIFDGRNLFEPATMAEAGIEYWAIGRSSPAGRSRAAP